MRKLININKLEFLGGTYYDEHPAKYSSFIYNEKGNKIANEFIVDIWQVGENTVKAIIHYRTFEKKLIVEDMHFVDDMTKNITHIVNIYNGEITQKNREKQLKSVLKR